MQDAHDRWAAGEAYEAYMGRWSRLVAREFLRWLVPRPGEHWLEIGCGTGALTSTLCEHASPASVIACDESASFVEHLGARIGDARVSCVAAPARSLPERPGGFDRIVSGLLLNFIPDPQGAVAAMRERLRAGGTAAAYLWDYAGGIDLLRHFWEEATACDPGAASLDESRRFASWSEAYVASLFRAAGLVGVESTVLGVTTPFASFEDFWSPFLGGAGPAPGYVATLSASRREELARRLAARLPREAGGGIRLGARAIAVRGTRP